MMIIKIINNNDDEDDDDDEEEEEAGDEEEEEEDAEPCTGDNPYLIWPIYLAWFRAILKPALTSQEPHTPSTQTRDHRTTERQPNCIFVCKSINTHTCFVTTKTAPVNVAVNEILARVCGQRVAWLQPGLCAVLAT